MGNPGKEYENSPHNAGFQCIDGFCGRLSLGLKRMGQSLMGSQTEWQSRKMILAKPQTYMNLSGHAVRWLVDYFHIDLSELCVIYDDIDLPIGAIRVRERGSAGSHKGMKSIVRSLASQDFPRIRIGIHPEEGKKSGDLVDYVLTPVPKRNRDSFREGIVLAMDAMETIIQYDIHHAMNKYNRRKTPCFCKEAE